MLASVAPSLGCVAPAALERAAGQAGPRGAGSAGWWSRVVWCFYRSKEAASGDGDGTDDSSWASGKNPASQQRDVARFLIPGPRGTRLGWWSGNRVPGHFVDDARRSNSGGRPQGYVPIAGSKKQRRGCASAAEGAGTLYQGQPQTRSPNLRRFQV